MGGLNGSFKLHLVVDSPSREEECQCEWDAAPTGKDFAIHSPVSLPFLKMNRRAILVILLSEEMSATLTFYPNCVSQSSRRRASPTRILLMIFIQRACARGEDDD